MLYKLNWRLHGYQPQLRVFNPGQGTRYTLLIFDKL